MEGKIIIKGARQHNLKNIDLEIPKDKMVVLTGLSGLSIICRNCRAYADNDSTYLL